MAPARAFAFNGTDSQYIQFLERLLLQNPDTLPTLSSPRRTESRDPLTPSPSPSHEVEFTFVQEDPSQTISTEAQWVGKMKRLIEKTPPASEWWEQLVRRGIDSVETNHTIITCLLHGSGPVSSMDMSTKDTYSSFRMTILLQRVSHYAAIIRQCSSLVARIQCLQKFVFVCLCIVLEFEGVAKGDVHQLMILVITAGSPDYLDRTLKGVKWMNMLIDELTTCGWGNRASELLMICRLLW